MTFLQMTLRKPLNLSRIVTYARKFNMEFPWLESRPVLPWQLKRSSFLGLFKGAKQNIGESRRWIQQDSHSQTNGRSYVDQNSDAEEAAPRIDAAHHLVEGPDDQTAGGDHLGHCRYGAGRMREPEDRGRDEKYAEREVWCLSNGDRSRLAVAETPEQKSSHHRVCPIQILYLSEFAPWPFAKLVASQTKSISASSSCGGKQRSDGAAQ
jgi:hypothetical protein